MLLVFTRTISMRWFFGAPEAYVKPDRQENMDNFLLKDFVYLDLCPGYICQIGTLSCSGLSINPENINTEHSYQP